MSDIQAIPTDYAGTRFRSKSEAIFARALDLSGISWQYEPKQWTASDGWVPDFWVILPSLRGTIISCAVEYKPAKPTEAYFTLLDRRFNELEPRLDGHYELVAWGSPFDTTAPRGLRCHHPRDGWTTDNEKAVLGLLTQNWEQARAYRFDLDHFNPLA